MTNSGASYGNSLRGGAMSDAFGPTQSIPRRSRKSSTSPVSHPPSVTVNPGALSPSTICLAGHGYRKPFDGVIVTLSSITQAPAPRSMRNSSSPALPKRRSIWQFSSMRGPRPGMAWVVEQYPRLFTTLLLPRCMPSGSRLALTGWGSVGFRFSILPTSLRSWRCRLNGRSWPIYA